MQYHRQRSVLQFVAIAGLLVAGSIATPSARADADSIRDRMRKILGSPDFRNLNPLKSRSRPRNFNGEGNGGTDGQDFRRDDQGNPVIIRDEKGRAKIGKDNQGRAVMGKDGDGRDVILRDQNGREFVVRDGKPDQEEVLKDNAGRNVVVRNDDGKVPIGKDAQGRAVIGKDQFNRDVILKDENGREVVVRDGDGRQGVQRDERGRRIIFRDEKGRAKIERDQQGRAVLGKDEFGRDVVLKDQNRRDVAARNDDARNGVLRDRQGRPVIFRDENQRAAFKRNDDKRGNMGRDAVGQDVRIRDQKNRDVFVFDDKEWKNVRKREAGDGPIRDGNRGDNRFQNRGDNNAGRNFERGRNVPDRNVDFTPKDTSTPSNSGPTISTGAVGSAIGGFLQVVGWIIVAIVAAFFVYLIGMGIVALIANYRNRDKDITESTDTALSNDPLEPETSPGELPADVYIQRARELAGAGKFREAIAQLLLGGMSNLERSGVVKYRKGLTHRDYVRASRSQPPFYQAMKSMVRLYEPLGFGRRTPSPQHFEQSLAAYEAGFRAASSVSS